MKIGIKDITGERYQLSKVHPLSGEFWFPDKPEDLLSIWNDIPDDALLRASNSDIFIVKRHIVLIWFD